MSFGISSNPLCVVFSPPDDEKISRESRGLELGSRAERSMRKLISSEGLCWVFWFLDWKRSMKIDFI